MKKLLLFLSLSSPVWAAFPSGATHCWLMNESSNTTRVDSIGTDNLTDTNADVGNAPGLFGPAANFNVTVGQILQTASNVSLPASSSISLWFNYSSLSPPHGANDLFTSNAGTNVNVPSSSFMFAYNDTSQFDDWGSQSFATNTTYHAVLTIDASYNATLYINGVSQGVASNWTGGASIDNFGNQAIYYYSSALWIQNVATWNRVLSGTEVSAIYNSGTGTSCNASAAPATNPFFFGGI